MIQKQEQALHLLLFLRFSWNKEKLPPRRSKNAHFANYNKQEGAHYWIDRLSGSDELRAQIVAGKSAEEIKESWQDDIHSFLKQRRPYRLYNEK